MTMLQKVAILAHTLHKSVRHAAASSGDSSVSPFVCETQQQHWRAHHFSSRSLLSTYTGAAVAPGGGAR